MIRSKGIAPLAVLAWLAVASTATAQATPELTAPVNDFAGVIGSAEEAELDALIRKLKAAAGDVIVVATVKTFAPAPDIQTFANQMFENRGKGIGDKGKDNGLLLVLAVDDREVWAEVGYDLEGIITDGFAGQTSRQTMIPFFRKGDYGGGMVAGATVLAERIAQARNVALDGVPVRQPPASGEGGDFPVILIIFVVMMIINAVRGVMNRLTGGKRGRRRGRWGSSVGPFGAGYGGWHSGGSSWGGGGGFGGGFGGFGGGRSGGGGGGGGW